MANRQWFIARGDKHEGPYPDERFRALIADGTVTAQTLVWSEGMKDWARAADIPGLMPGSRAAAPGALPPQIGPMGFATTGALSTQVRTWSLFWRAVVLGLCEFAIVPLPWMATAFFQWFVGQVELPGQQRVAFAGKVGDIWWVFILYALCVVVGAVYNYVQLLTIPLTVFLGLLIARWFWSNLVWDGQTTRLQFTGGYWAMLGWMLLLFVSFISIIGWAWVSTAWSRWMCRHVEGSERELVFTASGWSYLWRTLVVALTAILVIPIPWTMRWFVRWVISQFALVERQQHVA